MTLIQKVIISTLTRVGEIIYYSSIAGKKIALQFRTYGSIIPGESRLNRSLHMNVEKIKYNNVVQFQKPEHVSDEEWYAIDLSDPLMMVC